jgi:FdhE protein
MTDAIQPEEAAAEVRKAVERSQAELPAVADLLESFKELLAEQAKLKAELLIKMDAASFVVDTERITQGVPIAGVAGLAVPGDILKLSALRLIPAMMVGFPKPADQLKKIEAAVTEDRIDVEAVAAAVQSANGLDINAIAAQISVDADVLRFALGQMLRPAVAARSDLLAHALEGRHLAVGYCPVCGSWPSLSIIKGDEGKRYLKCSFCAHEWGYSRATCPFCENEDQDKIEFIYSEQRSFEHIQICRVCRRYVLGIDLRERIHREVLEVTSLRLAYLDILAQEQGFSSGAVAESDSAS